MTSRRLLPTALLAGIALAACAGNTTPTVMPRLDSLPDEHVAREERLDGAAARPGPESQKPKSRQWRRVETAAATAAAVVGSMFSTTQTTIVGVGGAVDENELVQPGYRDNQPRKRDDHDDATETYDPGKLTPWVQLKKPTPDGD